MDLAYPVSPFFGWLLAGSLKFVVNSVRSRRLAFDLIGYGGLPSTHAAITSTPMFLIGLREGWNTAPFAVAAALTFVVALDAVALRSQIQAHATALNLLQEDRVDRVPLRERWGHGWAEVTAGVLVGAVAALVLQRL